MSSNLGTCLNECVGNIGLTSSFVESIDGNKENARPIYDYDKDVYKLKLGRLEGERNCDWSKILRCIYIGLESEKMRKKTFDEIKETLAAVNARDVEIKMS